MVSEANAVHNWLKTTWRVTFPDDWLQACVEWIHSENDGTHAAFPELCNLVFEQWLVCDLREIGASCLPAGLSQHTKHVLNGTYGLQVNSMTDVGTSFYSQLQKVKGTENSNASVSATQATQPSWEPKPSRMLMMKLTDGTQDIQAMEYQPIPALNASLMAGTKIVVFGSVLCRSGVLMLKSENIRVLGGEVESLVEENTQERVLSGSLQHNIDLSVGSNGLPRKTFDVDQRKANINMPSSSVRQPRSEVASVVQSSWQTTVASERNNNFRSRSNTVLSDDTDEIPDDDLVTIATSVDELNTDPVQEWGEEDFDYAGAAEMMDCDFEDYDTGTHSLSLSSSVKKPTSLPATDKRLSRTENQHTPRVNPAKKPKTEADNLVKNSVKGVNDVDFDNDFDNDFDDDFDWQTSLSSVCQAKRKDVVTPARCVNEDFPKEARTLSSKLGRKAALTNNNQQRKREDAMTQDVSSSGSSDRAELRSVVSLADEDAQRGVASRLVMPAVVTAEPRPVGRQAMQDNSAAEQRRKAFSDRPKASHCSNVLPFAYLSQVMTQQCSQVFNVKAYISTLVSRLEHNQGSHWSLVVKINDGSAAVDVLLTNEILTELIGFSAAECMKMRQQAKLDKSIRQKLAEGIQRCQETLVQLSSIMEVEISPERAMPSVRSFRSVTESDVVALRQRIEFFKSTND